MPQVQINADQVKGLAAIGCTVEEIAELVGCSKRTLERRFMKQIEAGRLRQASSLRRMQYKAAEKGNPAILIWLGKQVLGQKQNPEYGEGAGDRLADLIAALKND